MCWSYRALIKYCELLKLLKKSDWLHKNLCYTCTYLIHFNPDMSPLSCLWFARDFHLKRALSARTTFSCVFCISDLSALFLRSSWCCFGFLAAFFFYFFCMSKKLIPLPQLELSSNVIQYGDCNITIQTKLFYSILQWWYLCI